MTCQTYIEEYLAAHADSELDGQAQSLADQHIGDCLRCRERFISERRLKTLIRTHSTIAKVSADVQLRIRAALGELVEADSRPAVRPGSADRGARRGVRVGVWTRVRSVKLGARAKIALPVAALGSLIVMLSLFAGHLRTGTTLSVVPPTQLFDLAVSKFNDFGQTFVANATDQAANRHDDSYYAW
ncbi:MAG: anti-sigma factor family protein, partial [Candidatus Binataceae bacterium]